MGITCAILWAAFSLCTQQFLAPPFVTWAIESGWGVKYHTGATCWVLTDVYTPEWRFCLDGTGENVTPYVSAGETF